MEWTLTKAAEAAEVSVRCARKWVQRYLAEGDAGLLDRSSAPHRQPTRTDEQRVLAIAALRRLRFTGPEIAERSRSARGRAANACAPAPAETTLAPRRRILQDMPFSVTVAGWGP